MWECGLKCTNSLEYRLSYVTPCVGVWIEMLGLRKIDVLKQSLPVWECGLKYIPN